MTSSEKPEPQGSEPSSTECRMFQARGRHCLTHPYGGHNTDGTCCVCGVTRKQLAAPEPVLFEKYEEPKPRPCTCGPDEACGDPCTPVDEPPMTPEEEEQAPEDGHRCNACGHHAGEGCGCPPHEFVSLEHCDRCAEDVPPKAPPQPERRAPYVATYSVGGHLYEVAVPGDACLQAVDGALVIRHGLGPVAGLVGFQPLTIDPQKEGQ